MLKLTNISTDKIFDLVVINDYPILSTYQGIHFVWLSDISQDKLEDMLNT